MRGIPSRGAHVPPVGAGVGQPSGAVVAGPSSAIRTAQLPIRAQAGEASRCE